MVLRIDRLDGERLVLDGYGLARGFFLGDPSSVAPGAYDSLAGRGVPDQITTADITAINTTMRARSPHRSWDPIANRSLDWLAAIDPALDLLATDDAQWRGATARACAARAGGRDRSVPRSSGGNQGPAPQAAAAVPGPRRLRRRDARHQHADDAHHTPRPARLDADGALREQGRANLEALTAIQVELTRVALLGPSCGSSTRSSGSRTPRRASQAPPGDHRPRSLTAPDEPVWRHQ